MSQSSVPLVSDDMTCAFGQECGRSEQGSPTGPEICAHCRNRSFQHLTNIARGDIRLERLVNAYDAELYSLAQTTYIRNSGYLCVMRHPGYQLKGWRNDFNRNSIVPCSDQVTKIKTKGELCDVCQEYVAQELAKDPEALPFIQKNFEDNKIAGFPCVFVDRRYSNKESNKWRFRTDEVLLERDAQGAPLLPGWYPPQKQGPNVAKLAFHEQYCPHRSEKSGALCMVCKERIWNMDRYWEFFDQDGVLLASVGGPSGRDTLGTLAEASSEAHYVKVKR